MKAMQPGARSEAIAGSIAGACQVLIICPVELAKTKLQLQGKGMKLKKDKKMYKGPVDCLLKVYRHEGISGCYKGMSATIVRDVPGFAFYFWLYHTLCHALTPKGKTINDLGPLELMFCGGMTGMISWGTSYPADVIKTRIQAEGFAPSGRYKGTIDCIRSSVNKEGWRVLTKGLSVCLVRAFPVNAATFAGVEGALRIMEGSRHKKSINL